MNTETLLIILKIILIIALVLVFINIIRSSTKPHKFGYLLLVLWIFSCSPVLKNNDIQLFFSEHTFMALLYDPILPILLIAYCGIGMIEGIIRWFNLKFTFYKWFRTKMNLDKKELKKESVYETYEDYKMFEEDTEEFEDMEMDEPDKGSLLKLIVKILVGAVIGKMIFPDSWEGVYACAGIAVGLEFFDKVVPFVIVGNSSFAIGYWILKIMLSMCIGVLLIPVMLLWYINGILGVKASKFKLNFLTKSKKQKYIATLKSVGLLPGQLDMYHIFPILRDNEDYEIIYNHCKNDSELYEFTHDWKDYFLALQSRVYLNPQIEPCDLYFTFDEWYQREQRWKSTSYHHLYYKQQEKRYI